MPDFGKQKEKSLPKAQFTEGVYFYFENGLMVLTEQFLRERGYCCKNGYRHCPSGFQKEEKS